MGEFVYTGPDDGRSDDASVKIENEAEAWGHQVLWDFELAGLLPPAAESKPKPQTLLWRAIKWLAATNYMP